MQAPKTSAADDLILLRASVRLPACTNKHACKVPGASAGLAAGTAASALAGTGAAIDKVAGAGAGAKAPVGGQRWQRQQQPLRRPLLKRQEVQALHKAQTKFFYA